MPIPYTPPRPEDTNNPSKEIFAASGIYEQGIVPFLTSYYYPDIQNSILPNTGILELNIITTPPPNIADGLSMDLRGGNFFIDDMLVFNKYIHYTSPLKTFDPQSFLQQSLVTFNIYSLENR